MIFSSGQVCLVLLHSLWQMALLAAVVGLVGRLWRGQTVESRYALHVAALVLGVALLPMTYAYVQFSQATTAVPIATVSLVGTPPYAALSNSAPSMEPTAPGGSSAATSPFAALSTVAPQVDAKPANWSRFAPWLLGIYVAGVVLMLVRLLTGIVQSQRLESGSKPITEGPLREALQKLSKQWSLRAVPALAYAERVVVPKVVGLVQPTILLPASALTGLTASELKMILAHELAHVRRHDMGVYLFQRLAEAVLFFNPALWYLSRRISTLREYCCDEMTCRAMGSTTDDPKLRYATALLRVVELAGTSTASGNDLAALAASGRSPSELRRRVARLFGEPLREPVRLSRGGMLSFVIVVLLLTTGPTMWPSKAQTADVRTRPRSEQVEEPATISGKIVLEDGSPATTTGWLHSESRFDTGPNSSSSDARTVGQFTDSFFCKVHSGMVWLLYFPNGYAPAWVGPLELKSGQQLDDVTITLKLGFSELIRVTDEEGEPVVGATIVVHPEINGKCDGPVHEKTTDAKGEYLFEHLADTRYRFNITAPGYQPLRTAPLRLEQGEVLRPTMIRSQPNTGAVRFADGTPASYTKIYCKTEIQKNGFIRRHKNENRDFFGALFTTCDSSGRFSLDQMTEGSRYLFVVEAPDYGRGIVTDLQAGQKDVQIILPRRSDLFVKIQGDLTHFHKRNGKPFVSVRQRFNFNPLPIATGFEELIGGDVPIELNDEGGTAIFRGLAVDLSENAGPQQVEVSLNYPNGHRKIVAMNLTGDTTVEFVLRDAKSTGP